MSPAGAEAVPDFRALVKFSVLQDIFLFGYTSALKNSSVLTTYNMPKLCFPGPADAVTSRDLKRDINSIVPGIGRVDVDVRSL